MRCFSLVRMSVKEMAVMTSTHLCTLQLSISEGSVFQYLLFCLLYGLINMLIHYVRISMALYSDVPSWNEFSNSKHLCTQRDMKLCLQRFCTSVNLSLNSGTCWSKRYKKSPFYLLKISKSKICELSGDGTLHMPRNNCLICEVWVVTLPEELQGVTLWLAAEKIAFKAGRKFISSLRPS